jgi:hypothetical protein
MVTLDVLGMLHLFAAGYGQHALARIQHDVLPLHARKFSFDRDRTVVFVDIDMRNPFPRFRYHVHVAHAVLEQPVHTILQEKQVTQRLSLNHRHISPRRLRDHLLEMALEEHLEF